MNRRLFVNALARILLAPALLPLPAGAEWRRDNKDECERIDDQLKDIENQRRSGYTPKQGRRLRAQREKLEHKRREQCR